MEWAAGTKISRQLSRACHGSGRRRHYAAADGDAYYCFDDKGEAEELPAPLDYAAGRASTPRWRALWRRIVRGKRRVPPAALREPYDPYTYAQNFEEQGSASWMEPENLSRSFSARFARPSGIMRRFA